MTRSIEILVATDGSTTVQTHGYAGSSCQEASRFLERALGKTTAKQRTVEFYATEPEQQRETEKS